MVQSVNENIISKNGEQLEIHLRLDEQINSFGAFSLHKAGSTLLNVMLEEYLAAIDVPAVNIPAYAYDHGIGEGMISSGLENLLFENGCGYLGWRMFPVSNPDFDFSRIKNILLVRDPRDRLVSKYFSLAYSHTMPETGAARGVLEKNRKNALSSSGFKEWVKNNEDIVKFIAGPLRRYHNKLPGAATRVYRYEDVIFKKEDWLRDMVNYFGLQEDAALLERISRKHDVLPKKEDPSAHIRKVAPGNYQDYFDSEVNDIVGPHFEGYLDIYGYGKALSADARLVFAYEGDEALKLFGSSI